MQLLYLKHVYVDYNELLLRSEAVCVHNVRLETAQRNEVCR